MGALLISRALVALILALPLATQAQERPPPGDGLELVRGALRQFTGTAPVQALVDRSIKNQRKDRAPEEGLAQLEVSAGSRGISIGYPPPLLERIRAERASTDPEAPKPARATLDEFDVADVADVLNRAVGMLSDLDGARVTGDVAATWGNGPARQLDFELVIRTSKADGKWVKSATHTMRLWVTPEGVPLASESALDITVGFLVFTFDAKSRRNETFARIGDRLVAVRQSAQFDGEGLGESTHNRTETTVKLKSAS